MARTKQTARKNPKGLPKAVCEHLDKMKEAEEDKKQKTGRKPEPTVKSGRVDKRKPDAPVRRATMEDQIRKAQRKVDLSFSKAYFARSVVFCIFEVLFPYDMILGLYCKNTKIISGCIVL